MRTPVSESRSPRKNSWILQSVIRQINHSQSQVEVCEAVIKDRLYLFTDSSHDDDNIQTDHSRDLSIVPANCQFPTLNFACPFEGARRVSAALFDA